MFLDRINGILQDNLFSYFDSFRKKLSKLNPALPEMVLIWFLRLAVFAFNIDTRRSEINEKSDIFLHTIQVVH